MKTQQRDQVAQQNGREHQQFGDLIGKQVMHALGEPSDLHRVQVQHLWADHYRVLDLRR